MEVRTGQRAGTRDVAGSACCRCPAASLQGREGAWSSRLE
jgi:hypothetical protein